MGPNLFFLYWNIIDITKGPVNSIPHPISGSYMYMLNNLPDPLKNTYFYAAT